MTLDQLRYFSAAAAFQHVGKAANSVNISPSVISAAILALSDELGQELFRRVGRNIELTFAGEQLYKRSQQILQNIDQLREIVSGRNIALEGKYRIGASHFLSARYLAKTWFNLSNDNPKLTADIYSMNTAFAVNDLIAGRIDLALCFSPIRHPELYEKIIHQGSLEFAVRKNHPIIKASAKMQHKFLLETPAIIHKSSQMVETCETHPVFAKLGIQPKIRVSFDSDDIAVENLKKTDHWSFLPDIVITENKNLVQSLPFPKGVGNAPYHISVLINKHRQRDPVLQKIIESVGVGSR